MNQQITREQALQLIAELSTFLQTKAEKFTIEFDDVPEVQPNMEVVKNIVKANKLPEIEHTPEFDDAIKRLNNGETVFITGKAGTGKTTLIKHWIKQTDKRVAIVAPTGVAAKNAGGVTIHSFFGLPPHLVHHSKAKPPKSIRAKNALKNVDAIVIDEVSMVTAPMIDNINTILQLVRGNSKPFGGVQIILSGDLFQLPPIVSDRKSNKGKDAQNINGVSEKDLLMLWQYQTEYFFSAYVFRKSKLPVIELTKVYRQKEGDVYLEILNRIRIGKATRQDFDKLNENVNLNYVNDGESFCMSLAPTNALVTATNENALAKLKGKSKTYFASIEGKFNQKDCLAEETLTLKEGAQVMFVANHPYGYYVNGTIGKVLELNEDTILVQADDGSEYSIQQKVWENSVYYWNEETEQLELEVIGKFTQFPLKLAYAITIHKSQGLEWDKMAVESARCFAAGQLYVMLSRCKSLEGLILKRPVTSGAMRVDGRVVQFFKGIEK